MLAGAPTKLDDFEDLIRSYGIVEMQRTGRVALPMLDRSGDHRPRALADPATGHHPGPGAESAHGTESGHDTEKAG
jgi:hypothetical protein